MTVASVVLEVYELKRRPANFQRFHPVSEEEQDNLANVQKAMQDWYGKLLISRQYVIPVEMVRVGLLCAINENKTKQWKRAVLTEIGSPNSGCKFLLFDYGTVVTESFTYARLLNEDFLYPLPEFLKKSNSLILSPLPGDVFYKKNDFGDENNLPEDVVEKSFNYSDQNILKMSKEAKFVNRKRVAVIVTTVDSPDSFYVRSLMPNFEEYFHTLTKRMSEFYAKHGNRYKVPVSWISEEFCCVANVDGSIFRVKIVGILATGIVKVKTVDSGVVHCVQVTDMFLLNSNFAKPPALAAEARLYGVSPVGKLWTVDDVENFTELTRLPSMIAVFFNAKNQDQLVCDLCDATNRRGTWLRETMIENGNALEADLCRLAVDGKIT